MRPVVASQLQTWWLHMTKFLVVIKCDLFKAHGNELQPKKCFIDMWNVLIYLWNIKCTICNGGQ
jgi:hypothetical protein